MGRLHFITTELDLCIEEVSQLTHELNEALKNNGCPNDRAILLKHMNWNGSVEIGEESQ